MKNAISFNATKNGYNNSFQDNPSEKLDGKLSDISKGTNVPNFITIGHKKMYIILF